MALEAIDSMIRLAKALFAFAFVLLAIYMVMPVTDGMINSFTTPGTLWATMARMAMWLYYIIALAGAPILVLMGKGTVLGAFEGAVTLVLGTVAGVVLIPIVDTFATLLLTDYWLAGAQIGIYGAFIACMVLAPLGKMLMEENEVMQTEG